MTAVIGGGIVACGLVAGLAVADVAMAYVALASFGMLGAFGAAARLRERRRPDALACPQWTAEDREWLAESGVALTGPQREAP